MNYECDRKIGLGDYLVEEISIFWKVLVKMNTEKVKSSSTKIKTKSKTKSEIHLCWDCAKAADGSCDIYEGITKIIDTYFDETKILFNIPECEFFIPEK